MPLMRLARPAVDGVLAGLAGTAFMTTTLEIEKRLRRDTEVIDYDATNHVVTATASVLHVHPRTHRQRLALFLLTHWGYGSAVAVGHEALRARYPERVSTPLFYLVCQSMAFVLFPTLGDTPAPWRWRRDVMATSLGQHVGYAVAVGVTSSWLRGRRLERR